MNNGEKCSKNEKKGDFDPGCIVEIYEEITLQNHALRAFAALLQTSDFSEFTGGESVPKGSPAAFSAQDLRYGLAQIIELCLAKQEQLLESYVDQYHESDSSLLKDAARIIRLIKAGAFDHEITGPSVHLYDALKKIETVIARGGELMDKAKALRASINENHKEANS